MPLSLQPAPTSSITTSTDDGDPHVPESIPPWVHVNDSNEKAPFLEPDPVVPNTRHYKLPSNYKPGRKLDNYRTAEPGLLSAAIADHQTRWIPFMQSGPNPRETRGEGLIRSQSWMEENLPIYARGWEEEDEKNPEDANKGPSGFQGIMYRGKWLISPERQERTVMFFWVSRSTPGARFIY